MIFIVGLPHDIYYRVTSPTCAIVGLPNVTIQCYCRVTHIPPHVTVGLPCDIVGLPHDIYCRVAPCCLL